MTESNGFRTQGIKQRPYDVVLSKLVAGDVTRMTSWYMIDFADQRTVTSWSGLLLRATGRVLKQASHWHDLFTQCPAIWHAKSCHFVGTKSLKTVRWRIVCAMLRHVVPSITHKLRTVHEMRDIQSHSCPVNDFVVVTSRDTLEIIFLNISKFSPRHRTRYFTRPASARIPTHTVTSSSLTGTPDFVPWRKPFVVPVWGLLYTWRLHATAPVTSGVNHQLNRSRLDQSFVGRRRLRSSSRGIHRQSFLIADSAADCDCETVWQLGASSAVRLDGGQYISPR